MKNVLIIGAKSDISQALARKYAAEGYSISLAAKEPNDLKDFANDLYIRYGAKVLNKRFDAIEYDSHQEFYSSLEIKPDIVITSVGYLPEQLVAEMNFKETLRTIEMNYIGLVSILNLVALEFKSRGYGTIIGISSVAGDRGRKSNYIYGSAKAGFTTYLDGLRNQLYAYGVHVLTVKPGFVATKMTENLHLPEKLLASPSEVANDIYTAQEKQQNILYTKWIWRYIMLVIKLIPESLFKRMNI